jgi:hypothetical protein
MREPLLFWASLATLPVAIMCFIVAIRVTSQRLAITLQMASQLIAGIAFPLMGYETTLRSGAKSILEMKANYAIGGVIHHRRCLLHMRLDREGVRQVE